MSDLIGWLYVGDDGIEWSANHPVRSGEMPDARLIRRATNSELLAALKEAWEAHTEAVQSEARYSRNWSEAATALRAAEAGWIKASDLHRIAVERAEAAEARVAEAEEAVERLDELAYYEVGGVPFEWKVRSEAAERRLHDAGLDWYCGGAIAGTIAPVPSYWELKSRTEAAEAKLERAMGWLRVLEPHIDAVICYASDMDEHPPNRVVVEVRAALTDTGEKTNAD